MDVVIVNPWKNERFFRVKHKKEKKTTLYLWIWTMVKILYYDIIYNKFILINILLFYIIINNKINKNKKKIIFLSK